MVTPLEGIKAIRTQTGMLFFSVVIHLLLSVSILIARALRVCSAGCVLVFFFFLSFSHQLWYKLIYLSLTRTFLYSRAAPLNRYDSNNSDFGGDIDTSDDFMMEASANMNRNAGTYAIGAATAGTSV